MMYIILHGETETPVAGSNSCDITRSTIQIVDDCPHSKQKWMEAEARKNCTAYANQCDEPERLVYHCVINEYVNLTLEVCAYAQNIVLGKCTSYAISGNVIQEKWTADCTKFSMNACPQVYRSDEAYKYPGCYQLTKKLVAVKYNPTSARSPDTTIVFTTPSSNVSSNKNVDMSGKEKKVGTNTATITIIACVLAVLIIVLIVVVCMKYGKKTRRRRSLQIFKTGGDRLLNAEENVRKRNRKAGKKRTEKHISKTLN